MNHLISIRNVQRLPPSLVTTLSNNIRNFSTEPAPKTVEEIVIPKRIKRGPTDILNALAATVGRDPTAAHYKYHDDPYLIPTTNLSSKSFAMAQEAGRKAARWIRETDRQWFNHVVCDPVVDAFLPKLTFIEESKVTESDLKTTICNVQVSDAILVYNLLTQSGAELSEETKLDFLQLLCFYNGDDTLDEEWIEERNYFDGAKGKDRHRRTWKDGGLAESIFNDLKEKTSVAYCTIIRGMAKYYKKEEAFALYQAALDKGIELDTVTYNSIISLTHLLKDTADARLDHIQLILKTMAENKVTPNLGTLNAILENLPVLGNMKQAKASALKYLAEFKRIGIEPSLGSYYYILTTFCKQKGPVSHVLVDIMNEIEGKSFEIQDQKDTFFFATAMDICRNHLNDENLAKRVDKLLHTGNNYNLIGNKVKETAYYRNFITLMVTSTPLDSFMELYHNLVPHIYAPEPGVMLQILETVNTNGAIEHVPFFWSQLIILDYTNRDQLVSLLTQTMIQNPPDPEIPIYANLPSQFTQIAADIWKKLNEHFEYRPDRFRWSGPQLGDLLTLLCRGGDFEKALEVFERLNTKGHEIMFEPSPLALEHFVNLCIAEKQPTIAIECLKYCIENGYQEGKKYGETLLQSLTLDEVQELQVRHLIGESPPK